ncbi:unnamed protein product [Prunus armeniaca]
MATSTNQESFSSKQWIYDVFLIFRGEDTRKNFTGHLYMALKEAGINAFIDYNELRRGEDITAELVQAIQGSRISVIVFSRRYADSGWCLEELVKIMECRRTVRQMVLPIFYDVDPSDVRKQNGCFGQAFEKHEERFLLDVDKVLRWRSALTEAANLSGWDLRNTADGHEARFIRKIIAEITRQLNNVYLFVAVYPVGINSRVEDMSSYLGVGSNEIRMVGILGMGGLGKTTIAKAIYNQFYHSFEGKSFVADVRETSKQPNGQVRLQEQLLSDILKPAKKIKVGCVDKGINIIKERLGCRKVLVIIDDADQMEQLRAIAGKRDWFGSGSRIIITTRDQHLLKQLEVDTVFLAPEMNEEEALELFSWHAFRNSYPNEGYLDLSTSVVSYCGGLPLALEVLGSFVFGRSIPEWTSALEKLKRIPHDQIQKKLIISFDGLSDDKQRDIFLDISCFFIGKDKNYVKQILDGCGFFAEIEISVLLQRCLVTVSERNKLTMHDLLRDMGREVVREKSPKEPGKCSRLWHKEDIKDVLAKHCGIEEIEGVSLNLLRSDDVSFSTKAFANMQRLRLLQLNYVQLTGSYEYLTKELRWLCWHGLPLKFIPNSFHQQKLVAIDLRYSNLTHVWKDPGLLDKLKILNLSHSHYLQRSPDFSKLPNLEKLMLKDCKSLFEVHPSIGHLERLLVVNLKDCKMLKDLPRSFYELKSIETLDLSGCSKFANLDDDLGKMVSLTTLLADNTAIRKVPSTILRLTNLKYLSLCGLKASPSNSLPSLFWSWVLPRKITKPTNLLPPSLRGLTSLQRLSLEDCNLTDDAIPKDLGSLFSLQELNLQSNSFRSLPSSLNGLSKLRRLILDYCANLNAIPELPNNLKSLEARNCTSLERIPNLSEISNMDTLSLTNCSKLIEIPGLVKLLKSLRFIRMEGCSNISDALKENILQGWTVSGFGGIFLPGNNIPEWFPYVDEGASVFFEVPQNIGCNLKELIVCIVYSSCLDNIVSQDLTSISVINYTKGTMRTSRPVAIDVVASHEDHLWQGNLSNNVFNLEDCDEVEVIVDFGPQFSVKKTGASLVWDKVINDEMTQYASGSNEDANVLGEDNARADIKSKRALADGNAGPSHGSSDEDRPPKR